MIGITESENELIEALQKVGANEATIETIITVLPEYQYYELRSILKDLHEQHPGESINQIGLMLMIIEISKYLQRNDKNIIRSILKEKNATLFPSYKNMDVQLHCKR